MNRILLFFIRRKVILIINVISLLISLIAISISLKQASNFAKLYFENEKQMSEKKPLFLDDSGDTEVLKERKPGDPIDDIIDELNKKNTTKINDSKNLQKNSSEEKNNSDKNPNEEVNKKLNPEISKKNEKKDTENLKSTKDKKSKDVIISNKNIKNESKDLNKKNAKKEDKLMEKVGSRMQKHSQAVVKNPTCIQLGAFSSEKAAKAKCSKYKSCDVKKSGSVFKSIICNFESEKSVKDFASKNNIKDYIILKK